jgi:hypothetical protein
MVPKFTRCYGSGSAEKLNGELTRLDASQSFRRFRDAVREIVGPG